MKKRLIITLFAIISLSFSATTIAKAAESETTRPHSVLPGSGLISPYADAETGRPH
ncbi:hypothetical protein MHI18_02740 [Peribacillus sp. FSL H8-0477]|uniref:hypothetical protein n=1 Tax=Peribacillus sp. FSL H8-0477 TaxID=2921388 RepID=UPI0030FA553F